MYPPLCKHNRRGSIISNWHRARGGGSVLPPRTLPGACIAYARTSPGRPLARLVVGGGAGAMSPPTRSNSVEVAAGSGCMSGEAPPRWLPGHACGASPREGILAVQVSGLRLVLSFSRKTPPSTPLNSGTPRPRSQHAPNTHRHHRRPTNRPSLSADAKKWRLPHRRAAATAATAPHDGGGAGGVPRSACPVTGTDPTSNQHLDLSRGLALDLLLRTSENL